MRLLPLILVGLVLALVYSFLLERYIDPAGPQSSKNRPTSHTTQTQPPPQQPLRVASWSMQALSDEKVSKSLVRYSAVLSQYDVIVLEGIRDPDGTAFLTLCDWMKAYTCRSTEPAGAAKEQYGVLYRNVELQDWRELRVQGFERPPLRFTVRNGSINITIYAIKTLAVKTPIELRNLEKVVNKTGNVVVLGDFNADCAHFNETPRTVFRNWTWAIDDRQDTTLSADNCTLDRIVVNDGARQMLRSAGVFTTGVTSDLSNRYPVWAELG